MNNPAIIAAVVLLVVGLTAAYILHRWTESQRRPVSIGMSFVRAMQTPRTCPGCQSTEPSSSRLLRYKEVVYAEQTKRSEYERSRHIAVPIHYCTKCKWLDVLFANLARALFVIGVFSLLMGPMALAFALAPTSPLGTELGIAVIAAGVVSLCAGVLCRSRTAVYMTGKGSDLRFSIRDKSYARSFREAVQQANRR